jgi:hypothetical protein
MRRFNGSLTNPPVQSVRLGAEPLQGTKNEASNSRHECTGNAIIQPRAATQLAVPTLNCSGSGLIHNPRNCIGWEMAPVIGLRGVVTNPEAAGNERGFPPPMRSGGMNAPNSQSRVPSVSSSGKRRPVKDEKLGHATQISGERRRGSPCATFSRISRLSPTTPARVVGLEGTPDGVLCLVSLSKHGL